MDVQIDGRETDRQIDRQDRKTGELSEINRQTTKIDRWRETDRLRGIDIQTG